MRGATKENPGSAALYVVMDGSSRDGHAHGGRDLPQPRPVNRLEQVRTTTHPSTDRWVVLRTVRLAPTPLFSVGVVDGFNRPIDPAEEYPTLRRARTAANRLYKAMTEEN